MTITIKLKTGNEAFTYDKNHEIERIIIDWVRRGVDDSRLLDSNGNTVGSVTVTGK